MKKVAWSLLLASLGWSLLTSSSSAQVPRFLIVGDSWAEEQWLDGSHSRVFADSGLSDIGISGALTTESGSEAGDWITPEYLDRISSTLAQFPHIDTVQLTVGGNDFLGSWNTGYTPEQFQMLLDFISNDVDLIIGFILNQRPHIEVVLSLYDYPNFEDTQDGWIWILACSSLWNDLGQPTPIQINGAAINVIDEIDALADENERVRLVNHFGQAQSFFGLPGIPPGSINPPGLIDKPSPAAAMRTRFSGSGLDCFHFNQDAYDVLVANLVDQYLDERYASGLELTVSGLEVEYNGLSQRPVIVSEPADQPPLLTFNGQTEQPVDAGIYAVVVTVPGWRQGWSGTFTIMPASQQIDFPQPDPLTTDQETYPLIASASSELPVDFDVLSGPASLNEDVLVLEGSAGTVVVLATQSGNGNWQPAEPVMREIEILAATDELFQDRFEPQ